MRGANASKVEVQTIMDVYARVAFYGGGASLKKFECEGASHNVATAGFGLHLVTWLPLLNFGKAELKDLSCRRENALRELLADTGSMTATTRRQTMTYQR